MAPGCKPGGLTPYAGSNPAPCTNDFGFRNAIADSRIGDSHSEIRNSEIVEWAGVAQLVEHQPSKLRVASSNLVARSKKQG